MKNDEVVLHWLISMTTYIANLHHRIQENGRAKEPETNKGPRYHEKDVHEVYDEGFARWMGWRGEEEQEREFKRK